MAYTLKLDMYYFSLKKITGTFERKTREGKWIGFHTEETPCLFQDFVNSLSLKENGKYMEVLLTDFINGFNASFKSNKDNTKAVSITTDLFHGVSKTEYTAWGVFKGGSTGINREIYKSDNATTLKGTIDDDNVTSLLYFYKLWLPQDSNVGILMVQSYTSMGCTALFKEQLEDYFISKGYKPYWNKCVPKSYIEKYLKDGYINEIRVVHSKRDYKKPLDPIFGPFIKATKKTIFNKFNIPLGDFLSMLNYKNVLISQIQAVDAEYDKSADMIKLFYTNNGKKAHASLANIEDILPVITLDDSLKDEKTQQPVWEDLHKFTKGILDNLKLQISYTPKVLTI